MCNLEVCSYSEVISVGVCTPSSEEERDELIDNTLDNVCFLFLFLFLFLFSSLFGQLIAFPPQRLKTKSNKAALKRPSKLFWLSVTHLMNVKISLTKLLTSQIKLFFCLFVICYLLFVCFLFVLTVLKS